MLFFQVITAIREELHITIKICKKNIKKLKNKQEM